MLSSAASAHRSADTLSPFTGCATTSPPARTRPLPWLPAEHSPPVLIKQLGPSYRTHQHPGTRMTPQAEAARTVGQILQLVLRARARDVPDHVQRRAERPAPRRRAVRLWRARWHLLPVRRVRRRRRGTRGAVRARARGWGISLRMRGVARRGPRRRVVFARCRTVAVTVRTCRRTGTQTKRCQRRTSRVERAEACGRAQKADSPPGACASDLVRDTRRLHPRTE